MSPSRILRTIRALRARDISSLVARGLRGRREQIGVYALDLAAPCHEAPKTARGAESHDLEWELLRAEDFDRLAEYAAMVRGYAGLTADRVRRLLDNECEIALALHGGEIVASYSMVRESHPLWGFEAELLFAEGSAYAFNLFVHPSWRGRGLGYDVNRAAIGRGKELGYRWLAAVIYDSNTPSIRLSTNLGYRKFGDLWMRERFFVRRYGFKSEVPMAGFTFGLHRYRGGETWF